MMELLKELLLARSFVGRVEWVGIAERSRAPMMTPTAVLAIPGGLTGDHHCRPGGTSKRQVTLVQAEHLTVVAALLGRNSIPPELVRRNLVISGINLAALKHLRFQIGAAVLEGTGNCPPCSRMEENLGQGGYSAMLTHGGITAKVVVEGSISPGDALTVIDVAEDSTDNS